MNIVTVYDCTGPNLPAVAAVVPAGAQMAGYDTGPGVAWTTGQYADHPGAVHIDQDPAASDKTADVLDVERGAATPADVVPWVTAAHENRARGVRAGQRWPAIYASQSNITPIANDLKAAGITNGVFFWVADWSLTQQQADADVLSAGGPWPVIGVQYADMGSYDVSVFSAAWLGNVAGAPKPPPPGDYTQAEAALADIVKSVAPLAVFLSAHKN